MSEEFWKFYDRVSYAMLMLIIALVIWYDVPAESSIAWVAAIWSGVLLFLAVVSFGLFLAIRYLDKRLKRQRMILGALKNYQGQDQ